MKNRTWCSVCICAAGTTASLAGERGAPAFDRIIAEPPVSSFGVRGISGDGNVVFGTAKVTGIPVYSRMATWTFERGVEVVDTESGVFGSTVWSSSEDGSVLAGQRAFNPVVWTRERGFRKLYPGLDASLLSVYWVSNDGTSASVSAPNSVVPPSHAYSWSEEAGLQFRMFPPDRVLKDFSIASRNGKFFAWASADDVRIREPDGTTALVRGAIGDRRLYYSSISNDGKHLAGWYSRPVGETGLFRMDRDGAITDFPMPRGYSSLLHAVYSADLSCAAITGAAYLPHRPDFPSYFAMYWREKEGIHPLHTFAGGQMPAIVSDSAFASAMSDDGSAVYGSTTTGVTNPSAPPSGFSFRVRLDPRPYCAGDINGDRVIDDQDFVSFANSYDELFAPFADQAFDLNADLTVDDSDFVLFLRAYAEGLCF